MNSVKKIIFKNFVVNSCRGISTTSQLLSSKDPGKKTSLFDFHVSKGGKIVNFAGYLLPVQYSDQGIAQSHIHTRTTGSASIFDVSNKIFLSIFKQIKKICNFLTLKVSHMLQTYVTGKDAIECFESITTADIQGLQKGSGTLTVFTNDQGGILDDLIVNRVNSKFLYVVSNAAMKEQDSQLILEAIDRFRRKGKDVNVKFFEPKEKSLLAFQGPAAQKVLQKLTNVNLSELYFMTTIEASVSSVPECRITRCGYTGEDGFEISIPSEKASFVAESLLESKEGNVKLAGLGPRDSLRLEAGLCLYGSDIDGTTTPIEAGLGENCNIKTLSTLNI
jgi:aminomethyltransferase